MAIKKWFADADASITNAYRSDLTTRGSGSNTGGADALEVFSLYGQSPNSTGVDASELSRIVIHFSSSQVRQAQTDGELPALGATNSPKYYLRIYNAKHAFTLPSNYTLEVRELTNTFVEGTGMDMDNYRDDGAVSWLYRNDTAGGTATGTITVSSNPSAGTFTVRLDGTDVTVTRAGNPTDTGTAIVSALNVVPINTKINASNNSGVVTLTSKLAGKAYNYSFSTTQAATGLITTSGDLMTGGSDFSSWASTGGDITSLITGVTKGTPTTFVVATGHNLVSGDIVTFANFDQTGWTIFNAGEYVATRTNDTTFTVPVNSSALANPTGINTETVSKLVGTQAFDDGDEDIIIDITADVLTWLSASTNELADTAHPGYMIKLPAGTENAASSKYTKKFFARSSEFFYKRPCIEARWDASDGDDRSKAYAGHTHLTNAQNTQNFFLYNSIAGTVQNFNLATGGSAESVYVKFYVDSDNLNLASFTTSAGGAASSITATNPKTGVYQAPVILNETGSQIYEKWFISTAANLTVPDNWTVIHTGSFDLNQRTFNSNNTNEDYLLDITNLKSSYTQSEIARFRLYARSKDWSPTIYSVASKALENKIVEQAYYKIFRVVDEEVIVDYGIGATGTNAEHTKLSYDGSGSYFDFDMSLLEAGYMYGIRMMFIINGEKKEQPEVFKFRVD